MKSKFSSPANKQESSPEGKLEVNYSIKKIKNQKAPHIRFGGLWSHKS